MSQSNPNIQDATDPSDSLDAELDAQLDSLLDRIEDDISAINDAIPRPEDDETPAADDDAPELIATATLNEDGEPQVVVKEPEPEAPETLPEDEAGDDPDGAIEDVTEASDDEAATEDAAVEVG